MQVMKIVQEIYVIQKQVVFDIISLMYNCVYICPSLSVDKPYRFMCKIFKAAIATWPQQRHDDTLVMVQQVHNDSTLTCLEPVSLQAWLVSIQIQIQTSCLNADFIHMCKNT